MKSTCCQIAISIVVLSATTISAQDPMPIDFAHDVVPILKKHCVECHGGEEAEGGFSLNTRALLLDAEAATPGKPEESSLIERILSADPDEQMPPKDRPRVAEKEIALLKQWIAAGVPWEAGFTFAVPTYEPPLRPRQVQLPPPADGRTNPIDRILDAYLSQNKLSRPEPISEEAFVRRVHYDLIGLPPTVERLESYLADQGVSRRDNLIEELLTDDEAYATHWLSFWNDLLRNAYSGTGYIDGGRRQITGWLYASLKQNKPFDEFTRELIAPPDDSSAGFIGGIKWRGNVNASQTREIQFAQSVSQVFLGINMKCASCHDSFIDRWSLDESYALAAVYSTQPLELYRCDKPTGEMAKAAWMFPELGEIDAAAPQPERLKQLADLMTHAENGRFTRTIVNRIWHRLMGRGIVHPVDAMHTEPWSHDLLDFLALHLVDNGYDLKETMRLIVSSRAYQSQAVRLEVDPDEAGYQYSGPLPKRLTAEQFADSISRITGVWPAPDGRAFSLDGRGQGGQLASILIATGEANAEQAKDQNQLRQLWGDRPLRAALTPLDRLQVTLGRPNREQIVSSRPPLMTTLEAIQLANGEELAVKIAAGAKPLTERFADTEALIDYVYRASLSRPPAAIEREVAGEIVGSEITQQGTEDLLWAVFMLPEFQLVR